MSGITRVAVVGCGLMGSADLTFISSACKCFASHVAMEVTT
jgi:hypothetical protein